MNTKSVLAVSHMMDYSGAPLVLFDFLKYLKGRGWNVRVVSPYGGPLMFDYEDLGIKTLISPLILQEPAETGALLVAGEVLLANTILGSVPVLATPGPSVLWVHEALVGLRWAHQNLHIREALIKATRVVHASHKTQRLYTAWENMNSLVVPYGVPLTPYQSPHEPTEQVRFMILGSIEPRKGQLKALQAFREVAPAYPLARLSIMGQVRDQAYAAEVAAQVNSTPYTALYAPVPPADLDSFMRYHDVLLAPSEDEIVPQVVLKAMEMGRMVLAADVGGVSEYVLAQQRYDPKDPRALVTGMREALDYPDWRREQGEHNRFIMGASASQPVYHERMEQVLEEAISHVITL